MRLVDWIDQHDDPGVAERSQDALQLDQQLVAIVGALFIRQRLAADFRGREIHQHLAERIQMQIADPHLTHDAPRLPEPFPSAHNRGAQAGERANK